MAYARHQADVAPTALIAAKKRKFAGDRFGVSSLVLAFMSSKLERTRPELAQFGNLCGASHNDPCVKPRLNSGSPLAYFFDSAGVSVEGKLSFGEDEFRAAPFVFDVDVAVYITVILLAATAANRSRLLTRQSDDA